MAQQILEHSQFPGGVQQDAAECLMHILQSADGGNLRRRLCGGLLALNVEGMLLCRVPAAAHTSHEGPLVNMANELKSALIDDQGLDAAPLVLVIRVENTYEEAGLAFAVDAKADWSVVDIAVSILGRPEAQPTYTVTGFIAHEHHGNVEAAQRMRSGHYKAYLHNSGIWFEMDDDRVTE